MFIKKKIFSVVKATDTSEAINMLSDSPNIARAIRDRLDMGNAFSIQTISLGAETGTRTATFQFLCTLDKNDLPYKTPQGANDIVTAFDCDLYTAADVSHIWSFTPVACEAMKIKLTLSGALTNGLDVYFIGY